MNVWRSSPSNLSKFELLCKGTKTKKMSVCRCSNLQGRLLLQRGLNTKAGHTFQISLVWLFHGSASSCVGLQHKILIKTEAWGSETDQNRPKEAPVHKTGRSSFRGTKGNGDSRRCMKMHMCRACRVYAVELQVGVPPLSSVLDHLPPAEQPYWSAALCWGPHANLERWGQTQLRFASHLSHRPSQCPPSSSFLSVSSSLPPSMSQQFPFRAEVHLSACKPPPPRPAAVPLSSLHFVPPRSRGSYSNIDSLILTELQ